MKGAREHVDEGLMGMGYDPPMGINAESLIAAWDEGHWEFTLAFEGLSDEDLWKRAHPSLLSVGELAGHVAYTEALLVSDGVLRSPLNDKKFAYYSDQIGEPVVLDLTVAQVLDEVKKIHEAAKVRVEQVEDYDEKVPYRNDWTWGMCLQYRVFHVAYHCGQAYSVRHLMGHTPTDN